MGLFSKKPNVKALLDSALIHYKNENFKECFAKVCEAAETGDARACFCKALLAYNDNINPVAPDVEELKRLTKIAVDAGYSLAYGFYAFILHTTGEIDELCAFCAEKNKIKDGVYLTYKASYYFGLYTDEENADVATIKSTIREAVEQLKQLDEEAKSGKNIQALEQIYYNPYNKFKLNYTYSHALYVLLTVLYCENDWKNRHEFMNTFELIYKYLPDLQERYNATSLYLTAILDNYLGMKDLNEANKAMELLDECFKDLDEEDQNSCVENYKNLFSKYQEVFEEESNNLRNRSVTYSDGYVDKNDLSLKDVASAVASGFNKWANSGSTQTTQTVYIIDGREYTRGEMGYLYDSFGLRTDWRVDNYSRLYDANDNELGYFNINGQFISK